MWDPSKFHRIRHLLWMPFFFRVCVIYQVYLAKILSSLLLFMLLSLLIPTLYAEERIVANPNVSISVLSENAARAIFGMRLRTWPDKQPIKVFVLSDRNPAHVSFAKKILSIFPHQLRKAWDRQVFSGTGQAPTMVESELAMRDAVANTPGAIGYLSIDMIDDSIRVVEVE